MSLQRIFQHVFQERPFRKLAWWTFVIYLLVYLLVTGFLVIDFKDVGNPSFDIVIGSDWASNLFRARAPFLYEAIGKIHLTSRITLFLSIPNLAIGSLISSLVAWNIGISYFTFKRLGLSGTKGAATLIGTIPALLGGAACCVPTLIILLGLQFTAALSALWSWFVPVSFLLLAASLWWSLTQAEKRLISLHAPNQKK